MAENTTHITTIHTVAIPVTDQDRALDFYVNALGFEVRMDESFGEGRRWVEVAPANAATTLALTLEDATHHAGVDTGIRLVTYDAAADHASLLARNAGVEEELLIIEGAPPMFSLRDPDGNMLYVVELREEAGARTESEAA
jgi:catechol 2,3-dioxygenase-like lactoylglutathione lyase family enzyme